MVTLGSGAQRETEDYFLSRFGAYLFAMNGDPREPAVAPPALVVQPSLLDGATREDGGDE